MNKTQARKAAEPIRQRFNSADGFEPETPPVALFKDVIDHYERERMPERYSTSQSYKSMLKVHIRPTWGETPAKDVRSAAVEA
jgi:hypothetical protein